MPYAFVLCGPPGCGKSSFVKRVLPNIKVCSTDNLILEYARIQGKTYSEVFRDYYPVAEGVYKSEIRLAYETGESFIVDRTNLTRSSRNSTLDMLAGTHTKVAIAFPKYPTYMLLNTLEKRPEQLVSPGIVKSMAEAYQYPETTEGFNLVFTPTQLEDLLKYMEFK